MFISTRLICLPLLREYNRTTEQMEASIALRWLGVAGMGLRAGDDTLLIDPFLTRFPFWRMWSGRVRPNVSRIAKVIPQADFVLVTHPHWDHLMDVPELARNTGATALGSPNVCGLLAASDVPAEQIREIDAGDDLALGSFRVEVLPAEHGTILGHPVFSGSLPPDLEPPLRARDYQMDHCFSFLVRVDGYRLLDWSSERPEPAAPADVLFVAPHQTQVYYEALLCDVEPQVIMPVHWDDPFRPLEKPVRSMLAPPRVTWPPLQRINLAQFEQTIGEIAPQARVLIPERFHTCDVRQLM